MESWRDAMKQWAQWLMGDAPLPGHRSKAILAGTVATAAAAVVAVPAILPSTPVASASGTTANDPSSQATQDTYPRSTVASPVLTQTPGVTATRPKVTYNILTPPAPSTTPTTLPYRFDVPVAGSRLAKNSFLFTTPPARLARKFPFSAFYNPAARSAGAHRSNPYYYFSTPPAALGRAPKPPKHASGAGTGGGSKVTGGALGQNLIAPAGTPSASASPLLPVLAPVDPVTQLVQPATPPPAPLATGAGAFIDSALVTWLPPKGGTPSGYDIFVGFTPGMEFPVPLNGATPVVGTSYLVTGMVPGQRYYFTVRARSGSASSDPSNQVSAVAVGPYTPVGQLTGPAIGIASTADGAGYWLYTASGAVSAHGTATDLGTPALGSLAAPITDLVPTADGKGYWEVAADGGVFAYGDAGFYGAASAVNLVAPIVGISATPDGKGYWEVAADGGVFAYGDAGFFGTRTGDTGAAPVVGISATPDGKGYWEVAADGGVFAYGDAGFFGSASTATLDAPVVGMASTADGQGYWEVTASGSVYAYGDAKFQGPDVKVSPNVPVVGISADLSTGGYRLAALDGGTFVFGSSFLGAG